MRSEGLKSSVLTHSLLRIHLGELLILSLKLSFIACQMRTPYYLT